MKKIVDKIFLLCLITFSCLIGIRIVNQFLKYDDRSNYKYQSSKRILDDYSEFHVAHPKNYDIKSLGKDTIIIVGDSFGEGRKCGNSNNISGCLSNLKPGKRIINLSLQGTSPAFYLKQIKTYLNSQRVIKDNLSGEKFIMILYSNDISLDNEYCNFYELNKSKLKESMINEEFSKLNSECKLISSSPKQDNRNYSLGLKFKNHLKSITGKYSFMLIREALVQIYFYFSKDTQRGRPGYINTLNDENSRKFILLSEVLKEAVSTCKKYNCDLKIATYPNVENIKINSKVRMAFLNFSEFMKERHDIKIYDGYEPFISNGIKNASFSIVDIHSNCKGYNIYAKWLNNLK